MDTPAHPVNKVVTGAGGKVLAEHYKYVQVNSSGRLTCPSGQVVMRLPTLLRSSTSLAS
jgi:hypothetical protein